MSKSVEDRIREHYQAESGEWLIEKGKIKEARLLKEAHDRIRELNSTLAKKEAYISKKENEGWYNLCEQSRRDAELEEKEKRLEQMMWQSRLTSVQNDIARWTDEISED